MDTSSISALGLRSGATYSTTRPEAKEVAPPQGLLSWVSEGSADAASPYYSRRAHVPSASSGVTIGRGYDLRMRSSTQILRDLIKAGLTEAQASEFSKASGLFGNSAREFLRNHSLPELSPAQEVVLFTLSWQEALADVVRISDSASTIAAYGRIDWLAINPAIMDLLVDLRFRGDYTPTTRAYIQRAAANNDLPALAFALSVKSHWANVPRERFEARLNSLTQALAKSQ